jgi:nicotinamide-nucleotide amidase
MGGKSNDWVENMSSKHGPLGCVISVGAELLSADRLETNSHEIQKLLLQEGFRITRSAVVDDRVEDVSLAIGSALEGADFIIITGGLGPTVDDVTRQGVADAAGVSLREDPKALADIQFFFKRMGREMKPSNRRQALIPEGGEVLPNPIGTAPAFVIYIKGKPVYSLPGVPSEMRLLMKQAVVPHLTKKVNPKRSSLVRTKVHLIGLTESSVNDQIEDLLMSKDPRVNITVHHAVITLTLTSEGSEARNAIEGAKKHLQETFRDKIFGVGEGVRLEETVGKLLIERGITVALAESCTGGLIGHLLTSVPGISTVFLEGVVAYSGEAKVRSLDVPESLLEKYGQVSREVAEAMARGAAIRAGAKAGLGITGIAGPGGGTHEKPVGLVHMAVYLNGRIRVKEYRFSGTRNQIKKRSANLALDLLRRSVLDLEG